MDKILTYTEASLMTEEELIKINIAMDIYIENLEKKK